MLLVGGMLPYILVKYSFVFYRFPLQKIKFVKMEQNFCRKKFVSNSFPRDESVLSYK
jgi:hypothetical protein